MPNYDYLCPDCGKQEEVNRPIDLRDAHLACQICGAQMGRVLSTPAIRFKGSGFYTTDYGR